MFGKALIEIFALNPIFPRLKSKTSINCKICGRHQEAKSIFPALLVKFFVLLVLALSTDKRARALWLTPPTKICKAGKILFCA
jgi:hypothetical protein